MIPIFNKKRIQYSIILMMLMLSFKTYSQCTGNTSLYPSGTVTPVCNGTTQTITTAGYASEYSLISVTSGTTYTFTSNTGDYLTIANASGGAPVYAFGTTPVVWTATFTGTIRMYNNSSGPGTCGTSTSPLRTRTVKCGTPPAAPSNDNCSGATAFPAIPTNGTCSSLSNQSTANATASGVTPSGACTSNSGSPDDDVWFSFVATTTSVILSATYVSGSTDVYWQVFSGSCASTMTALLCTDTDAGGTITGLTIGQTYYIKMYTYSSSVTSVQTICLSAPYDPCSSITNIAACGSTVNVSIPSGTGGYASSACYTAPGKEMIYTFTPATTGLYYIQQFSSFTYIDYEYKAASGGCSSSGWTCIDDISGAGTSISGITLTAGVQYYIALDPENTAGGNVSFSIVCPPPDPCLSITNIATCGSTVNVTIPAGNGTYASSACYTAPGREMIYSFTPSTTGSYYIQQFSSFTYIDYEYKAASGGCSSTGWTCIDDISGAGTSISAITLTAGVQYYIALDPESTAGGNISFTIKCPPTPPSNDDCTGATSAAVSPSTTCASLTNGTLLGATASSQANGCNAGNDDNDVWYSFVATSPSHSITINNIAGSETDMYHSVYAGTCGSLGTSIDCSDPNTSLVNGLTVGNTYYIRVYTYSAAPNATTTFSVCIKTPPPTGPCGNPANNDFCSNPATLTQGPGTFSSSTSGIYSSDQASNLSGIFCGSIENNSWYQFIATSTTHTFPFTSITGCTWGDGVQAQVYSATKTATGCCTAFTSKSNCYNPGTTSTGTVTATGLTIGQTYILMVDGYAGDVCNFTVSGWTAVGILPLQLMTFVGHNEDDKNKLEWVTSSEENTAYFSVERSRNGVDFEKLLDVTAAGKSNAPKNYNVFDMAPFEDITYYRLKLYNTDYSFDYSNIVAINNQNLTDYIANARPNPTNGNIEFDVNTRQTQKLIIEIYNNTGNVISSEEIMVEEGYKSLNLDLSNYNSGIYLLKVSFAHSGKTDIQKIIKN